MILGGFDCEAIRKPWRLAFYVGGLGLSFGKDVLDSNHVLCFELKQNAISSWGFILCDWVGVESSSAQLDLSMSVQ